MSNVDQAIDMARTKLMLSKDASFLATVALSLNIKADESCETADINGLDLRINSEWFLGLSEEERVGVMAHHSWHVALEHQFRGMLYANDMSKFNKACDHEVNTMLYDAGYKLPPNSPCDMQYHKMPAEKIYKLLEDEDSNDNDDNDGGNDNDNGERPNDNMQNDLQTPPDKNSTNQQQQDFKHQQDKVTDAISKAVMQADMNKQAGSVPNSIREMLDKINNPRLPWNVILENYLNERTKEDYSWSKRNRRYQDVYLPALYSEGMGEIRMYGDQSGSFGDVEFAASVAELKYIQDLMNPTNMVYRAFTCTLTEEEHFPRDTPFEPVARVCGGTSIGPVIEDIRNTDGELAVIFTDGYFSNVDMENLNGTDIIWVIVNNPSWECPMGFKTIHMEINDD